MHLPTRPGAAGFKVNLGRRLRWLGLLAALGLAWENGRAQVTPTFTLNHPLPTLRNLQGTYFSDMTLTTPVLTRDDGPTFDFNWGLGSPGAGVPADNFSVRWTATIVPRYSESYTLYATSDDGIRVWVNDQLLIDSWVDQAATEHASNPIDLVAGVGYALKVEFYENFGDAVAQLSWSSARQSKAIVGVTTPPDGTGDGFGSVLTSLGDGRYAVGAPQYDDLGFGFVGTVLQFADVGHVWYGDAGGDLQPSPTTPVIYRDSFLGTRANPSTYYGAALATLPDGRLVIGYPGYSFTTSKGTVAHNQVGAIRLNTSPGLKETSEGVGDPGPSPDASYFGHTVAGLGGNRIAASSFEGAGVVYLFDASQEPPAFSLAITNPNPPVVIITSFPWTGSFGSALAALGTDRLLVGSPQDSVAGDNAGSVFVYDFTGLKLRTIHNFTGRADLFGSRIVAVDDHRFLIGAPAAQETYIASGQSQTNASAGAVYLYDDNGTLLRTFTAGDVSMSGNFGTAISLLGQDRVLVGSPAEQIGQIAGAGAVHLFSLSGTHLETIANPAPSTGDGFGAALAALDDHQFVVGAPGDSTLALGAGGVYGFDAPVPAVELGSEIPRPATGLDVSGTFHDQGPAVTPAGAAFWHVQSQKLFAVKPGGIFVTWPLQNPRSLTPPPVYNWQASIGWPTNTARYQVHVAGQTPVDLTGGGAFSNVVLQATTTDANPSTANSNRVFSAQVPGLSLLMLSSGDPSSNALRFQLVRTIAWNDPASLVDNAPATIGQPIADPGGYHDAAAGSPQVVIPGAPYCPAPVFDPATRTGTIIPVNRNPAAAPPKDLVVAFYQQGARLYDPATGLPVTNHIYWPYQPVRFIPQWPTNAPKIVIASQLGTGPIDPAQFANWQLYYQNDPSLPGFNPNDEHALRLPVAGGDAVFALRNDLGTPQTSQPFVLIRYQDPANGGQWRMKVWQVLAEESPWFFQYSGTAGLLIQPPLPLSTLAPTPETVGVSGPYWRDRKLSFWAKAAGDDGSSAEIVMLFFYPMQPSFFYPGTTPPPVGTDLPWLDLAAGTPGTPIDVHYEVAWPTNVPELRVAETLVKPKFGLPDIASQTSVEILYQQAGAVGEGGSVELIDPTAERFADLAALPDDVETASESGVRYFPTLPPQLRTRFFYDPTSKRLKFRGQFVQPPAGEYYLLLNVITPREHAILHDLSTAPAFQAAVDALSASAATVTEVPPDAAGFDSLALTAGFARGQGYVTLAFGNNPKLSPPAEPVSVAIIKVTCPTYQGEVKVIESDNPFDEKLTLRHSGDFAGQSDSYIFEWRTLPPVNGLPSTAPPEQWTTFSPSPATGQGAVDITIQGPGLFTLSDNYFICRYRPLSAPLCTTASNTQGWSDWTAPMLAEGWVKRVLRGINPFEQRIQSYQTDQPDKVVSMISQAGPPFQGNVPLDQAAANQFGLIETYETVLRRGKSLSIEGLPSVNYGPANDALLLAAGRLADLYMLLGNEAYADAADPTIAFGTDDHVYGAEATSIHCFMNQTASLMEEELDLLRGRDNSKLPLVTDPPVYNRLIWNFTSGIDGGEVAYALNYNIRDQEGNVAGTISAADAAALYPQGHGDAWGHYLSAIKNYYRLLRNPNFTWVPRIEAVMVGGVPVSVDYYDERKFAAAAAARAQTGAEIVNLTYRSAYVEDPAGQWQGYTDSNTNRAWGLAEWGSRAGQGALFDWIAGNALLPDVDADPTHTGIQKIDRTTVTELRDIVSAFGDIQSKVDQADAGLNPLGLAKNVIPFDIDPNQVASGVSHFDQIYQRAVSALNNAVGVFNYANNSTQLLRRQADSIADFQKSVTDREADFNSRLIEIFGYPYGDDIGPTGSYPSGYNGPDLYHYDYVDASQLEGETPPPTQTIVVTLVSSDVATNGQLTSSAVNVPFVISSQQFGLVKPPEWTLPRRAPGQIQMARSDLLQAYARFQKALQDYKNLIAQIEDKAASLADQYQINASEITLLDSNLNKQRSLDIQILGARTAAYLFDRAARSAQNDADAAAEGLPKVTGIASDVTSGIRAALQHAGSAAATIFSVSADLARGGELLAQQDKEISSLENQIKITTLKDQEAVSNELDALKVLIRQESSARLELFDQEEALQQFVGRYNAALASGERLLEDRLRFRQETAAQIQQYRYKDMAFRIFRNDALQKYRAQFDVAAMYVYMAARAYDYETSLKKGDPRGPGSDFMRDIIQCRSLGLIQNGQPQTGSASGDAGLADAMARMNQDWAVLKPQLGVNNRQTETGRFSLRSELFRIQAGSGGSKVWRDTLTRGVVANLFDVPEFNRYCIPFQPHQPTEPALVIPFATSINFGQNFFGWPAGGGDNTYDSTHFATKIASVGVWFANYNNLNMVNTPHVYLIPVGDDVMRSPSGDVGDIRQWKIIDEILPVPFPFGSSTLTAPGWLPLDPSPTGQFHDQLGNIRQYAEFRAYHDSGNFDPSQTTSNTRLIGRSVWNTHWLLIIPAGELLSDRNEGLQRFINGSLLLNGQRDGNGVTDIKIFFQTYAYSGN